ncbi:MAG: acyltransferase [bacterium]|nr:acyltransferase [bacterium]
MNIFDKLRSVRYGFGTKSNIGKKSCIKKDKKSTFIHSTIQMREYCKIVIRKNSKLSMGSNIFFNRNTFITCQNSITMGNNVIIGPNVVIVDHNHDYKSDNMANSFIKGEVFIGNNVWIGANCTILPGAHIEDGAIIGANSTISKKVGANEIWGGVPAKFIKNRFE